MIKKVYILLADGFETIEALTPVDILRRCGIEVVTLSIGSSIRVKSSQDITVDADSLITSVDMSEGSMLIFPGGFPGYKNLGKSREAIRYAREYLDSPDKFLGAICGAPFILDAAGLINGRKITCHYSVRDFIHNGILVDEKMKLIQDGNLITAKGAGVSIEFGLKLAEVLIGKEKVEEVKRGLTII